MTRALRVAAASCLVTLLISTAALAVEPIPGGVYADSAHNILIGVVGTHEIRAFNMTCRGKIWVARGIIGIHLATGDFSYSGTARLARNGRVTSTSTSMNVVGVVKNAHLISGHATAASCSTAFRAGYAYTR